jgi:cytochrome c oxidase subunit IV
MSMIHGHDSVAGEGRKHHGPSLAVYLGVAAALGVFTAVSFIVSATGHAHSITGLVIIMTVAVCKAILVGAFFMHLTYDWGKLYFLIIPALILGVMMMIVLTPDMVMAWRPLVFK